MDRRIAHHPALADLVAPRLELRLDQRQQPPAGLHEAERHRQHLGQCDEAGVTHHQVDRLGDMGGLQQPRAQLFMDDHPWVLSQLPRQLVGAAVDRIDPRRAARQQHIGKAPGRRPDIDRHRTTHVPAEMVEAMRQLDSAARHPGMIASAHVERRVGRQLLAGLVHLAVADEHQPRHDERLRPGPAFGQAAIDEHLVRTLLCHGPAWRGFPPVATLDRLVDWLLPIV